MSGARTRVRLALRAIGWPVRTVLLVGLAAHRRLASPALGARCRFHPTCSAYAEEAIRTHGVVKGLGLSLWRVARCSPLSRGGLDPVPASGRAAHMSDNIIRSAA